MWGYKQAHIHIHPHTQTAASSGSILQMSFKADLFIGCKVYNIYYISETRKRKLIFILKSKQSCPWYSIFPGGEVEAKEEETHWHITFLASEVLRLWLVNRCGLCAFGQDSCVHSLSTSTESLRGALCLVPKSAGEYMFYPYASKVLTGPSEEGTCGCPFSWKRGSMIYRGTLPSLLCDKMRAFVTVLVACISCTSVNQALRSCQAA